MRLAAAPDAIAKLDAYAAGDFRKGRAVEDAGQADLNYAAIRGREQQLIDVV
jgi:hypothetical protein